MSNDYGALLAVKDPAVSLELRRIYQLLSQQISSGQLNVREVCQELGRAFKDGEIEALNRVLKAEKKGSAISLTQAGSTPCVYLDSAAGTGNIIDSSVGANLDDAGVWNDACTEKGKVFLEDPDPEDVAKMVRDIHIGRFRRETSTQHFGPTAEAFHEKFRVGNGRTLAPLDLAGVAVLALKASMARVDSLERRVRDLEARDGIHDDTP